MLYQQLRSRLPLRPVERGKDDVWRPVGPQPEPVPQPGQGNWRPFQIAFLLAALPELVDRPASVPVARRPDLLPDRRRQDRGVPRRGGHLAARPAAPRPARRRHRRDHALHAAAADGPAVPARRRARLRPGGHPLPQRERAGQRPVRHRDLAGRRSTPNTWKPRAGEPQEAPAALRASRTRSCCCAARGAAPRWDRSRARAEGQDDPRLRADGKAGRPEVPRPAVPLRRHDGSFRSTSSTRTSTKSAPRSSSAPSTSSPCWPGRQRPARSSGWAATARARCRRPSLIIQDELHLISGPLGSMVGLYETVIDDLCTDRRGGDPVPPKIIASTATIRRYEDQVAGLYGREQVALFPPHGLEEGHSFFAEPATLRTGRAAPGRRYLGDHEPSLGSTADRPGARRRRHAPGRGRDPRGRPRRLLDQPQLPQQPARAGQHRVAAAVRHPGLPDRAAAARRHQPTLAARDPWS